jgi:hypothetical protein
VQPPSGHPPYHQGPHPADCIGSRDARQSKYELAPDPQTGALLSSPPFSPLPTRTDRLDGLRDSTLQLYDRPAIWQKLVTQAGFSLSRRRLTNPAGDARPADSPAEWLLLAQEIAAGIGARMEEGQTDAVQVTGVEAGSEGVEARLFWGPVTPCALRWLGASSSRRPLPSLPD